MALQPLPPAIAGRLKPWLPQGFDFTSVRIKQGGFLGFLFGVMGQSAVTWNQTVNLTPRATLYVQGERIEPKNSEVPMEKFTPQVVALLGHECWHVKQQREMGWWPFLWAYIREWLAHGGGRDNKLEMPAYELGDRIYVSLQQP